jgi:hypothetical protein
MSGSSHPFRGPGEWRSQADGAQHGDGNVFAQLADMMRRMADRGLDTSGLQEAVRMARAGLNDRAAEQLRAVARELSQRAPSYGVGLNDMADRLPRPGDDPAGRDAEIPEVQPE